MFAQKSFPASNSFNVKKHLKQIGVDEETEEITKSNITNILIKFQFTPTLAKENP